jgi:hypothetical protein
MLSELESSDPKARFSAFVRLRYHYEEATGEALVRSFTKESESGVWWLAVQCVIPLWLPKLDLELKTLEDWTFTGSQTLRILELSGNAKLHSCSPYVPSWKVSSDWRFKFAALRWLKVNGEMTEALEYAQQLLITIQHGFELGDDGSSEGGWMNHFWSRNQRIEEIAVFLISCGEPVIIIEGS